MGKYFLLIGLFLLIFGSVLILFEKISYMRLPGDIYYEGKNVKVFIPITSSIILSLIITIIVNIILKR